MDLIEGLEPLEALSAAEGEVGGDGGPLEEVGGMDGGDAGPPPPETVVGGEKKVAVVRFGDILNLMTDVPIEFKVCMKGAALVLGVSLGFFYERSKRSQVSRLEGWLGAEWAKSRELIPENDCCKGTELCCVREDVNFRTETLLTEDCCSRSSRNRKVCHLKRVST